MAIRSEKAKAAILRVLGEAGKPIGASQIAGMVLGHGVELQARTIRHYLLQLDEQGLTRLVSRRRGRELTALGREEAERVHVTEDLGIVSAKIDALAYRMTFDTATGEGTVIVNVSIIDPRDFGAMSNEIDLAFNAGVAVGRKIVIARGGEHLGTVQVPEGMLGVGTVCSITLNGILQKAGIPVMSRFGGLLEIRDRQPIRFLNMIEYRGTTLDPIAVFMRADMTRVRNVALRGSGIVSASFREIPAAAAVDTRHIEKTIRKHGISGIIAMGKPSVPLFGVSVSEGYCGLVVAGGLNTIAAAKESGLRISSHSLTGLEDYSRFVTTGEARRRAG